VVDRAAAYRFRIEEYQILYEAAIVPSGAPSHSPAGRH
jgi:hypothetical protein